MRASLDTNVIIHLYKAGLQSVLFDVFDEGVFIYEQIRGVELENHGQDVLEDVDADIASGKIEIYTDKKLKDMAEYDGRSINGEVLYLIRQAIAKYEKETNP